MSIYDVDWDEEFGRKKPAQPRPPCTECAEHESLLDCSECGAPLCKDCMDFHFEKHGDEMKHSELTNYNAARHALAEQPEINSFLKPNGPAFSSRQVEWNTPPEFVRHVVAVLRAIDLDPCADAEKSIPAKKHFRLEENGLAQEWVGRIYMNPPYRRKVIDEWTRKFRESYAAGDMTEGIALVPARTDTQWFRDFDDMPACFITGRLKFSGAENSAPFPSAVIYAGRNLERFAKVFEPQGHLRRTI